MYSILNFLKSLKFRLALSVFSDKELYAICYDAVRSEHNATVFILADNIELGNQYQKRLERIDKSSERYQWDKEFEKKYLIMQDKYKRGLKI